MNIAFLYNTYKTTPNLSNPKTLLEVDFDSPETITAIIKNLEECGYNVIPIEANEFAYYELVKNRSQIDLAFNYAEGIKGKDREAHIPAILEMLQIPYTGCSPLAQATIFNKARTKEILILNNIPTLPFQVFKSSQEPLNRNLIFPLIIKPIAQGQSAGITSHSLVHNFTELKNQIEFVIKTFKQPAMAEPFLTGREFSVGMIGNPPEILAIVELNHTNLNKNYPNFASFEVKFAENDISNTNYLSAPAIISNSLESRIYKACIETWNAIEIQDWCRIDIRCDESENPFVLEINSPASIEPQETINGYCTFPLSAEKAGYSYHELLKKIINSSLKRYGKHYPNIDQDSQNHRESTVTR